MRINRVIQKTRAEGPGVRFAIWAQGCHNACPGCYATALWDETGGEAVTLEALITEIRATKGIEGITLLGGEPFEQAAPLAQIAEAAQAAGLSVVTFTGLTYEEILAGDRPEHLQLLKYTDLLIDGAYIAEQRDFSRPWVGSSNQRYLFLTDRYSMADVEACRNHIEFRLDRNGVLRLNGMGDFEDLERMLQDYSIMRCNDYGIHKL